MANFRSLPFSIFSLLLLASLIMADVGGGGGEGQLAETELLAEAELFLDCPSLNPCRAGYVNKDCCKKIDEVLKAEGCACVCRELNIYGAPTLTTNCYDSYRNWCPKCNDCVCRLNPSPLRRPVD